MYPWFHTLPLIVVGEAIVNKSSPPCPNIVEPLTVKFDEILVLLFKLIPSVAAIFTLIELPVVVLRYSIPILPADAAVAFVTLKTLLVTLVIKYASNVPSLLLFLTTIFPAIGGSPDISGELSSSNVIDELFTAEYLLNKFCKAVPVNKWLTEPLILNESFWASSPNWVEPLTKTVPAPPTFKTTLPATSNPLPNEPLPSTLKFWLILTLAVAPSTLNELFRVVPPSTCNVCLNIADEPDIWPNAWNVPLVNVLPLVLFTVNLLLPISNPSPTNLKSDVFVRYPFDAITIESFEPPGALKLSNAADTAVIVPFEDETFPFNVIPLVPSTLRLPLIKVLPV